uniref:Ribonuclease HII n=1 Tax=viral metagenome TaxID=1070528 RepID=A0A6C0KHD9_9ZZZZ
MMKPYYTENIIEAGIDEVGRGPLFGRVYTAAVILPNDPQDFNHQLVKDSKKFTSHKKILQAYDYIKDNAIDYKVSYIDEKTIDKINIRKATHKCMHNTIEQLNIKPDHILVDGNDFPPYIKMTNDNDEFVSIPHTCIEGGDNIYASIAAASIIAKVERDQYINDLCDEYSNLDEYYQLRKNKGYGTSAHMNGIKKHGITEWHRRSFGICKSFV